MLKHKIPIFNKRITEGQIDARKGETFTFSNRSFGDKVVGPVENVHASNNVYMNVALPL